MQNHNTSKISEKQEIKGTEKNKLRVACYCRVGSAKQLSSAAEIEKVLMPKGGEYYHAKP